MEFDFSKQIGESEKLKQMLAEQKSRKEINNLPDSDFAYIEPGGKKDDQGKTVPRSLRHLPIMDCAHVRNALARLSQTKIPASAKASALKKIKAAAKKCDIKVSESDSKDWEKIDKDELKHDTKKEKKEHYKDAIKDDEEHIKKLKKDEKIDKKKEAKAESDKKKAAKEKFLEMIKKKKKGDDDGDDEKEDDDKDEKKKDNKKESKAVDYKVWQPVQNLDIEKEKVPETKDFGQVQPFLEQKADTDKERHEDLDKREEKQDKGELDSETLREKIKHHEDAIKNLKKEMTDLRKDKKEDKGDVEKELKESRAPMGCPECY